MRPVRRSRPLAPVALAGVALAAWLAAGCGDGSGGGGAGCPVGAAAPASQCGPGGSQPSGSGGAGGVTSTAATCAAAGDPAPDSFATPVPTSTLPDGLAVGDIRAGAGPPLRPGQTLTVQYTGWLSDGTEFDTSKQPGSSPLQFVLGARQVIAGWDEGLASARVGSKRRLVVPPQLGYGASGSPPRIPPGATLVFDVEVLCAA